MVKKYDPKLHAAACGIEIDKLNESEKEQLLLT